MLPFLRRRGEIEVDHPVPSTLGRNKKCAQAMAEAWREVIGPCALIYTRSDEGEYALEEAVTRGCGCQPISSRSKPTT